VIGAQRLALGQIGNGGVASSATVSLWDRLVAACPARCPARGGRTISCMAEEEDKGEPDAQESIPRIDRDRLRCSFCGKAYVEVETIVCGPTPSIAICNECVELYTEIMAEERDGPTQAA
jgi:ClpX C4-type zinc finger